MRRPRRKPKAGSPRGGTPPTTDKAGGPAPATSTPPNAIAAAPSDLGAVGGGLGWGVRSGMMHMAKRLRVLNKTTHEDLEKAATFARSTMANAKASRRDKLRAAELLRQIGQMADDAARHLDTMETQFGPIVPAEQSETKSEGSGVVFQVTLNRIERPALPPSRNGTSNGAH